MFHSGISARSEKWRNFQFRPVLRQNNKPRGVELTPEYERTHLLGTTFNNAFGDWVLRGEFGYSTDRFYLAENLPNSDGVVESGEFSYVLGVDYQGFTDTFISTQFFQTLITDHKNEITQDEIENSATFLIERKFLNETLTAEFLVIHNFNDADGALQAELSYQLRSNIDLKLGVDSTTFIIILIVLCFVKIIKQGVLN